MRLCERRNEIRSLISAFLNYHLLLQALSCENRATELSNLYLVSHPLSEDYGFL